MNNRQFSLVLVAAVLSVSATSAFAQSSSSAMAPNTSAVPADNTKSNQLDSNNTSATADSQKDNASDRKLTQRIRRSVMADKTLSVYAHNVKIVTVNGTVTLNGVVRSDDEKSTIEAKAVSVAGLNKVVNDLKVTPPKS